MNNYIESKINHMKRAGLVIGKHNGLGRNGGACPTWLSQQQKNEDKGKVRKIVTAMQGYVSPEVENEE